MRRFSVKAALIWDKMMIQPTEVRESKESYIETFMLDKVVIPHSEIVYESRLETEPAEILDITLVLHPDFPGAHYYRIVRYGDDRESKVIRFYNKCTPGNGCKTDTEEISYLPPEIIGFLRHFPGYIREMAGAYNLDAKVLDINKVRGIFHNVDYLPKSLHRNNPKLGPEFLREYADRYAFNVILIEDCGRCGYSGDVSRTWDGQPEKWEELRIHFAAMYKLVVDLEKRKGQVARCEILWNFDEPEMDGIASWSGSGDISLDSLLLDFVQANPAFFREEDPNPPQIPKQVLRYIIENAS